MSEEDLELLITLDDPGDAPEEDTFNHLHAKNNLEYWLGQQFPIWRHLDQRAEVAGDNDAQKVTFGQGDWTCTLSRLTVTTNDSMKGLNGNVIEPLNKIFDVEVCTVTRWKNGEVVEQKVFYELLRTQKQTASM